MHLCFLSLKRGSFTHLHHKGEWEGLCVPKQGTKEVPGQGVGNNFISSSAKNISFGWKGEYHFKNITLTYEAVDQL